MNATNAAPTARRAVTRAGIPPGWDEAVTALDGHFLQSGPWARVQARLGFPPVFGGGANWCWFGVVGRTGPFRYLYLPFGPTLRTPDALADALGDARGRAARLGCAFVRFEPRAVDHRLLHDLGATRARTRQHECTMKLRIDVDEATLRRGLKSGHRTGINGAERRGLRFEHTRDASRMSQFVDMLRQTEQRAGFYSHDDAYFEAVAAELLPTGDASLYFAMAGDRCTAGALVFDYGSTRYYAFGATDSEARKLMPAPPLVWRIIMDARAEGRRIFDFWGAAPPGSGPDHPWAGITYFKSAFGAELEQYAGTWELPVRQLSARIFRFAEAVRR